jgi:hypothetical protein
MDLATIVVTAWDIAGIDLRRYLTAVPQRHAPPARLVRASFRDGDPVRTRPLAHLPSWAPERIDARRRALKGACDGVTGAPHPLCGPLFAVLLALQPRAERLGLRPVRGAARWAPRVLWRRWARVAAQGSRLAAVRWAPQPAVAATRGGQHGAAADRAAARARLAAAHEDREDARSRRTVRPRGGTPPVVWSDVTASALAGEPPALAALGSRRDRQPGPAPRVMGRLTTAAGAPVAVPVYAGHTAAPVTGPAHVHTRRTRFGITAVVGGGDRGLGQAHGTPALPTAGCRSLTALTPAPVRRLLQTPGLRPE